MRFGGIARFLILIGVAGWAVSADAAINNVPRGHGDGQNCLSNQSPLGVDGNGNAQGCFPVTTPATDDDQPDSDAEVPNDIQIASTQPIATAGFVQVGHLTAGSASCIARDSGDRLYGDLDCDGTKDAGEEFLDNASSGGTNHALLSATHTDTVAGSPVEGSLIVGNSSPAWAALAIGATGTFLRSNGTAPSYQAITDADVPDSITASNYTPTSRTITINGTANQITSSAGAQDLTANRTWTLSLPASVAITTGLTVGGQNVCREDGTNCPAGAAGDAVLVGGTGISDASGVDFVGGTNGIDINLNTGVSPDIATFNFDSTEVGTVTWGSGSSFAWTFDASAGTDPSMTFGAASVAFNAVKVTSDGVSLRPMGLSVCKPTVTFGSKACDYEVTGTDDDVPINAAITAAASAVGLVVVYPGTYVLDDKINGKSYVTLYLMPAAEITIENSYVPTNNTTLGGHEIYSIVQNENSGGAGNTKFFIMGAGRIHAEGVTGMDQGKTWGGINFINCDLCGIKGDPLLEVDHILETITVDGGSVTGEERFFAVGFYQSDRSFAESVYGHHTGDDVFSMREVTTNSAFRNVYAASPTFGHCAQVAGTSRFGTAGGMTQNEIGPLHCRTNRNVDWTTAGVTNHRADGTRLHDITTDDTGVGVLVLDTANNVQISNVMCKDTQGACVHVRGESTASNGHIDTVTADMTSASDEGVLIDAATGSLNGWVVSNVKCKGTTSSGQACVRLLGSSGDTLSGITIGPVNGRDLGDAVVDIDANGGTLNGVDLIGITGREVGYLAHIKGATDVTMIGGGVSSVGVINGGATDARGIQVDDSTKVTVMGVRLDVDGVAVIETGTANENHYQYDGSGSGTVSPTLVGASSWAWEMSTHTMHGMSMTFNSITLSTVLGTIDASAAKLMLPKGTTLVTADCDDASEAGRIFVDTDATTQRQLYICEGAAGWKLQGDGSGSGGPPTWDAILNPVGNQSLDMGSHDTAWSSIDSATFQNFSSFAFQNITAFALNDVVPTFDKGTGAGGIVLDGSLGGCPVYRDTDDAGWTECCYLNGTPTCGQDADGIPDGTP